MMSEKLYNRFGENLIMAECLVYATAFPDDGWSVSDVLTIVSIVANLLAAGVFAYFVGKNLSCDREYRNYFIKEVCDEKKKHEKFWDDFENSNMSSQEVFAWLKQRNMSTTALMKTFREKKKKTSTKFENYVRKMRTLIDETDWFQNVQINGKNVLSSDDRKNIAKFKNENASIFHEVIAEING